MNKAKTFFSAVLLGQIVLNTAAPVLASPYYETSNQNNRRYSNSASTTEKVENNSDWTGLAVLGTLGAIWLWSTFNSDGGGSTQTGSECGANISQSDCNWHKQQRIENQRFREAGIGY